ncbi:HlyD family efflux transporter periplasmic adaptor subunit [Paludibaculum fermentans]|uniref:HlyD family efflux transporter periplasmic adaptor subunit n=1 Tax=Paludibaculum fermentans TaxID=1473598 RepID=A0A7S7NKE6_PALFE|nr:HlyD family efflux transporter periplasmic adaptor subunit [Paludibaculum fermentans]QOY85273.1 HlyD family efflux transporter periplasmic adaptor subunit [Paludibaculum fermentans]
MKKVVFRLILIAVVLGAGYGVYHFFQGMSARQQSLPTTKVRRGDVVVRSFTRGELRAVRTASLAAPNLFGTVQVTKLAPLGALAREKNLIVEFDDSEVLSRLESRQLELDQVDEQIKKAQADLAIRNNQDQVDLLRARYAVRRAELEVKRNEILAAIDQKKNILNLDEARRRLKQLESDIKSKQEQALAEINVLREKRNRSLLDINREKMRLSQVKLLSPIGGLVAVRQNRSGFSGMFGTQVPDIREGDQVPPGTPVADVLDLSELEVIARVGELDRANLREGQEVVIRLDALAEKVFDGKIKSMSGTASANVFSSDPGKKFDVVFSIDMKQLLTTLGAKPDAIARILALAEENRKKPLSVTTGSMFGGMPGMAGLMGGGAQAGGMQAGGMPAGAAGGGMQSGGMAGMQGGMPGAQAGGDQAGGQGGQRRAGGFGMGANSNMTPEQQKKMQEILKKALNGKTMIDLSPEERQAMFAKVREEAKKAGIEMPQRGGNRGGGPETAGGAGAPGAPGAAGGTGARGAAAGAPSFGPQAPGAAGGGNRGGMMGMGSGGAGGFSAKDLENATLPPPPEEGDTMEVLLRPGLLADVEILVEKVPNAIYVPNQSIFEKDGKPVVYVKSGENWVARNIKIDKRSESVTVVTSGVNPGDTISLADPNAKPGDKKKADEKKSSGGAAGALPVGGSKGGQ